MKTEKMQKITNGKTWVVGDIHGCYDAFMDFLNDPEVKPEDTIILIGDIIDRGPKTFEMLEWAKDNITADGRFQMVMGNHEDEILYAYNEISHKVKLSNKTLNGTPSQRVGLLSVKALDNQYGFAETMINLGLTTVNHVEPYVKWMKNLPEYKHIMIENGKEFIIAHAWFKGKAYGDRILPDIDRMTAIWHRDVDDETGRLTMEDYEPVHGEMLVHGHTPIPTIKGIQPKPLYKAHSVNIDGGCHIGLRYGGVLIGLRLDDMYPVYTHQPPVEEKG